MISLSDIVEQSITEITADCSPVNKDDWETLEGLQPQLATRAKSLLAEYGNSTQILRLSLASYFLSFLILFFQKRGPVKTADILDRDGLTDLISLLGNIFVKEDAHYKLPASSSFDPTSFLNLWMTSDRPFSARQAKHNFILDLLIRHDLVHKTRLSSRLLNDIRYIIYSLSMQDSDLSFDEKKLLDFLESESEKVKKLIGDEEQFDIETYAETVAGKQAEALLKEAKEELGELIGLNGIKHEVKRLEAFLTIQKKREEMGLAITGLTLHFVFQGNPGTGKTTVARILGKLFKGVGFLTKGHVEETDRSGLVAEYMGQTATKTRAKAEAALDGILFIDEAYALSRNSSGAGNGSDSYGREAIETMLKFMEDNRKRIVVIVAGYPKLMTEFIETNPGLKSRFTRYLNFEDFEPVELCRILHLFAKKAQYSFTDATIARLHSILFKAYSSRGPGFGNARFVRNLFEEAMQNQAMRLSQMEGDPSKDTLMAIEPNDLPEKIDGFTLSQEDEPPPDFCSEKCPNHNQSCPTIKKVD